MNQYETSLMSKSFYRQGKINYKYIFLLGGVALVASYLLYIYFKPKSSDKSSVEKENID